MCRIEYNKPLLTLKGKLGCKSSKSKNRTQFKLKKIHYGQINNCTVKIKNTDKQVVMCN